MPDDTTYFCIARPHEAVLVLSLLLGCFSHVFAINAYHDVTTIDINGTPILKAHPLSFVVEANFLHQLERELLSNFTMGKPSVG